MKTKKNCKTLELTLPAGMILGMADARFRVRDDDGVIGELQVSKGSVVWFTKAAKKGYRLRWEKFDRLMCEKGTKCRNRD